MTSKLLLTMGIALLLCCCAEGGHETGRLAFSGQAQAGAEKAPESAESQAGAGEFFAVAAPPFSEDIFPCMECHEDMEPDFTRREIEDHEDIVLVHGDRQRWCFDCHDPENRDMLRLAGGTKVPFTESYRLCGQCHGDKYRDWRKGTHGKRTGEWAGKKEYLLCAHCHNPHSPKFKPIKPMPAPDRPKQDRETQ